MYLRKINLEDKKQIMEIFEEYNNLNSIDKYEGFKTLKDLENMSYIEWLNMLEKSENEEKLPNNYSPYTQYIAVLEDDTIVGGICLRWKDTPSLLMFGGHIGYSIRPTKRNMGYGSLMLKLALEEFKKKNKDKVLVSCKDFNISSKKVIEKNGGVYFDSYYDEETKNKYLKYWIKLN